MKVAILSHSNAHERQILFFQELAKHCEVLLIAPSNWGSLEPGNLIIFTNGKRFEMKSFPVVNPGNIYNYLWHARVFESISEFKPDLIYSVSEWQSLASRQVKEWSKQISCKFVLFTWDNLNFPDDKQRGFLRSCDLVICGNKAAFDICERADAEVALLLHVGIDVNSFKPKKMKKHINVLSVGRKVLEKGGDFIAKAYPHTEFLTGVSYEDLPNWYNRAKLHVTFPYSCPTWSEQSMGYVTIEAMSCGIPVISTDCGGISEYLSRSKANIIKQKDLDALKECIQSLLLDDEKRERQGVANRKFVVDNYSNTVIAKKLFGVLKDV